MRETGAFGLHGRALNNAPVGGVVALPTFTALETPLPAFAPALGVRAMWTLMDKTKRALWEFVEIAFLAVLALVLIFLLLGPSAGAYVVSVADNVSKFASTASSGVLGIVIVLAIGYLALRRVNPDGKTRA